MTDITIMWQHRGHNMKHVWIAILLIVAGCCNSNFCFINDEDITNMYSSYVEEWKTSCKESFDKAEKEIFIVDIVPKPDDGTNEDPAKCVCKGTGVIVQGDGHKTVCPFHGKTTRR